MVRRLSAEERALWRKVVETVRPFDTESAEPPSSPEPAPEPEATVTKPAARRREVPPAQADRKSTPGTTLDGGWDRRLAKGQVAPDLIVDLHGQRLAGAHALLDARLESAIAAGDRLMLLITGKPPAQESRAPRGAIRAAIGDWLAASRHAPNIAAVRAAHPRHGGAGALYIVLRRPRMRR